MLVPANERRHTKESRTQLSSQWTGHNGRAGRREWKRRRRPQERTGSGPPRPERSRLLVRAAPVLLGSRISYARRLSPLRRIAGRQAHERAGGEGKRHWRGDCSRARASMAQVGRTGTGSCSGRDAKPKRSTAKPQLAPLLRLRPPPLNGRRRDVRRLRPAQPPRHQSRAEPRRDDETRLVRCRCRPRRLGAHSRSNLVPPRSASARDVNYEAATVGHLANECSTVESAVPTGAAGTELPCANVQVMINEQRRVAQENGSDVRVRSGAPAISSNARRRLPQVSSCASKTLWPRRPPGHIRRGQQNSSSTLAPPAQWASGRGGVNGRWGCG